MRLLATKMAKEVMNGDANWAPISADNGKSSRIGKKTLSSDFDNLKRATYTSRLINIYSSKWTSHMRFFLHS